MKSKIVEGNETMKKLIAISMIVAGTLASAGAVSAASVAVDHGGYNGWQTDAFSGGDN